MKNFSIELSSEQMAIFQKIVRAFNQLPQTLASHFVVRQVGCCWCREYTYFSPTYQMLALAICENFGLAFQEGVITDNLIRAWCVFPESSIIIVIHPSADKLGEPMLADTLLPQFKRLYKPKALSRSQHLGGLTEEVFAERLVATTHVFSLFKNPGIEARF